MFAQEVGGFECGEVSYVGHVRPSPQIRNAGDPTARLDGQRQRKGGNGHTSMRWSAESTSGSAATDPRDR